MASVQKERRSIKSNAPLGSFGDIVYLVSCTDINLSLLCRTVAELDRTALKRIAEVLISLVLVSLILFAGLPTAEIVTPAMAQNKQRNGAGSLVDYSFWICLIEMVQGTLCKGL